jgi:hypothetical protein
MCQCDAFEYHEFEKLKCEPQKIINGNCSVDFNCRVDKYLECNNGTCQCISAYPLWSGGCIATTTTSTTWTTSTTTTSTTSTSSTTTTTTTKTTTTRTGLCNQGACAVNWKFLRGKCYKNVLFSFPGGFERLTPSDVVTKCGIQNSTLALSTDFNWPADQIWLYDCLCPPLNKIDSNDAMTYYGPILGSAKSTGTKCPTFKCNNYKLIEEHECAKGDTFDYRSLFCKYTP